MNKLDISKIIRSVQETIAKHSPEIMTGIGIAGMITTTIMAVQATPKALRLIEDKKVEDEVDSLTKTEVVKTCWKCYIPSAVTGTLSVACLIGASSVNAKRNAALATAYKLSETALSEYQDKVVETIGEKKEQVIRDAVAKEKLEKDPVVNHEIIMTGKDTSRCYDAISGRYFTSDINTIQKAENILNKRMMDEMYVSLNDFYYEIDLPPTPLGDELGWHIDNGFIELRLSAQLGDDGLPYIVVDYRIAPKYHYGR